MGKQTDKLSKVLTGIVGEKAIVKERSYLKVRPRTAEEVSQIMKVANKTRCPVTPRGGGSTLLPGTESILRREREKSKCGLHP